MQREAIKKAAHMFQMMEIINLILVIGILLMIGIPHFIHGREQVTAKSDAIDLRQAASSEKEWVTDTQSQ